MKKNHQQGVVSLFIVIFTTLLLTVLVVGFLRLMIQEQKQATNQDLSQSAYDSAVSGVEDAKRVLRACKNSGDGSAACNAIKSQKCDTVAKANVVSTNGDSTETVIQSNHAATNLNQGYTCVIINSDSNDYLGNIKNGESQIIPLKAKDTVKNITIEWMHKKSGTTEYLGGDHDTISAPTSTPGDKKLPNADGAGWNADAPAMLRVQSVLPPNATSVSQSELDTNVATTTFLRPNTISNASNATIVLPSSRATSGDTPVPSTPRGVACSNATYTSGGYACKVTLQVPANLNNGLGLPAESNVAFLRITSLYKDTSYRITLSSGTADVAFDGVQPMVDSTGRADNVYRRVVSRLKVADYATAPAAIDISGNLCKNFYVTDNATEASDPTCSTHPQ